MASPSVETGAGSADRTIVAFWAGIYDTVYDSSTLAWTGADYTGWRNRLTGRDYSDAEMAEWVAATVTEIRALAPDRLLELGSGSGLLVRQLLPRLSRYVGVDISGVAVERLARTYAGQGRARFLVRDAADIGDLGGFDTVVINSVLQHFPHADYLQRTLSGAVGACAPDGVVFAGDVHSLPLRPALRLAGIAQRSSGPIRAGDLRAELDRQAARERELAVDPAYFTRFAAAHGLAADIRLKTCDHPTEMTRFRYDARLRPRTDRLIDPARAERIPWRGAPAARLRDLIATSRGPVVLAAIPHPGQHPLVQALSQLDSAGPADLFDLAGLAEPAADGWTPAALARLAGRLDGRCFCVPSRQAGRFDAILSSQWYEGVAVSMPEPPGGPLATTPSLPRQAMAPPTGAGMLSSGQPAGTGWTRLDRSPPT